MVCPPFGGVLCRGHAQYPAFSPDTLFLLLALQKWQLGFWFLYVVVQNLPQLHIHAVIFIIFIFIFYKFTYLFIFGCVGCSLLHAGFL